MEYFADDQMEEQMEADLAAAAHQHEQEVRELAENFDWQAELDMDPGYHAWIDELEAVENERRFNVLTPWDEVA